jgi:hypothetical protein
MTDETITWPGESRSVTDLRLTVATRAPVARHPSSPYGPGQHVRFQCHSVATPADGDGCRGVTLVCAGGQHTCLWKPLLAGSGVAEDSIFRRQMRLAALLSRTPPRSARIESRLEEG